MMLGRHGGKQHAWWQEQEAERRSLSPQTSAPIPSNATPLIRLHPLSLSKRCRQCEPSTSASKAVCITRMQTLTFTDGRAQRECWEWNSGHLKEQRVYLSSPVFSSPSSSSSSLLIYYMLWYLWSSSFLPTIHASSLPRTCKLSQIHFPGSQDTQSHEIAILGCLISSLPIPNSLAFLHRLTLLCSHIN